MDEERIREQDYVCDMKDHRNEYVKGGNKNQLYRHGVSGEGIDLQGDDDWNEV